MALSAYTEALAWLLGDPLSAKFTTVPGWVQRAEERLAQQRMDASLSQLHSLVGPEFEEGAALLHDSRLVAAQEKFLNVAKADFIPEVRILARLGHARTQSALRRYPAADVTLVKALKEAKELGNPTFIAAVTILKVINESDWGEPPLGTRIQEIPEYRLDVDVAPLLKAYATIAGARLRLRTGRSKDALRQLEQALTHADFAHLAIIPRCALVRMYGIVQAMNGDAVNARTSLQDAVGLARNIEYVQGEVDAVLSLARVHAPLDRRQTEEYLARASELLEPTDMPTRQPRVRARQIPGARAAYYSRKAEFEFARGAFRTALENYQKDLEITKYLAGEKGENAPRAMAYVRRHLGRVNLALGQHEEAAKQLKVSEEIFRRVGDNLNALSAQTMYCEARFAMRDHGAIEDVLNAMEESASIVDEHSKEAAVVKMLRAQSMWVTHLDAVGALGLIRDAKDVLRSYGRDDHYVRLLLVEAEVLLGCRDEVTARFLLREARSCALSLDAEDLRQRAEKSLVALGAPITEQSLPDGRVELAILFADIRGFTDACRKVDPRIMAEFIAQFAETISRYTSLSEGRPVRFLGDCVMAVFGLQESKFPKELLAIEAAVEIHKRFCMLRERSGAKVKELGAVGLGFGVSSGPVIAGRFGTTELSEYSVIGEAVNLASRLQGEASDGEIMLASEVARCVSRQIPEVVLATKNVTLKGIGQTAAHAVHVRNVEGLLARVAKRSIPPRMA